jgi:hypothetical protein
LLCRSVITDQFGPLPQFATNFERFACGEGFLGLINSVEAEEVLTDSNTFLLRFSRREPEKLTVSFKVKRGNNAMVRHRRKPIGQPIEKFITTHFCSLDFLPVSKRIADNATLFNHVDVYSEQIEYLIQNGPFDTPHDKTTAAKATSRSPSQGGSCWNF